MSLLFPLFKNANFSSLTKNKTNQIKTKNTFNKRLREKEKDKEEKLASMTTRETRERRTMRGERDVWGVIVKCDDICFTHILPRLNRTDLKFLYEVNSETRKLVKRSSRAGDLKKEFEVREMSSISTLEVAWEH